jgi:hypothetical protein
MKLPKYNRPIKYVCTRCGGWWEGDANRLIVAGMTGFEPDDPQVQEISSARDAEMTIIDRHSKRCGGNLDIIYESDPRWDKLDANKRET